MSWIVDKGYAHYWGTSEWPIDMIAKAREICKREKLNPPVCEQPEYSMLKRPRMEKDLRRLFSEDKMGATIYSPLAGGLLTGKYNEGEKPDGTRFK